MPRYFPGNVANYFEVPASEYIPPPNITVMAWVYMNVTSTYFLVNKYDNNTLNNEWNLGVVAGPPRAWFRVQQTGGTGVSCIGTTTLVPGRWYCLVGSQVSGPHCRVYVDGKIDGWVNDGRNWSNSGRPFRFGRDVAGNPLNGMLSDCAVWNINLRDSEVYQLAQRVPPSQIRPANLYGWWNFDGSGNAPDRSRRGQNATLNGTVNPRVEDGPLATPPRFEIPIMQPSFVTWVGAPMLGGVVSA